MNYPVLHRTSASLGIYYTGPQLREHPDGTWREQHPNVYFHTIPIISTNLRLARDFEINRNSSMKVYLDIGNLWVSKFRNIPGGQAGKDYYSDLYAQGKEDRLGTEEVTNKDILRTHSEVLYAGEYRSFILGMRFTY